MADLQQRLQSNDDDGPDSEDEEDNGEEECASTVKNFDQFAVMLAEMRKFALLKGCGTLVDACMNMEEKVATESLRQRQAASQTSLLDFFKPNGSL